ncbi:MAG TPA: hypothetical protein DD490_29305 [Acidobacteria bacterium]|nr:hypothetical protein [Acidobacteriota bacterium]
MITIQPAANRLSSWEPLRTHLSAGLLSAVEDLRTYIACRVPRLFLFAAQPKILAEWREAAAGELPEDWEVRESILPDAPETSSTERFHELCCDAVVIFLPVLHMDPPAARVLADRLRPYNLPIHLVLLRFHQIAQGAEVVRRKREEAARRFDLAGLRVLACSGVPGTDLLGLANAVREIRAVVEKDFPAARERQVTELSLTLDSRVRDEIRAHQAALRENLKHLREETAVARSAERSVHALTKTVGEAFHRWSSGFLETVGSLVWADVRQRVQDAAAESHQPEHWAKALREALAERIAERWQRLAATRPFDLEQRLESLLTLNRQSAEKNATALAQGPIGLMPFEVARVQRAAADEEPFRDLRRRCQELAERWQPLTSSEINRVLQQECRGLDIALADLLGRKLPSLVPPPRERDQPWLPPLHLGERPSAGYQETPLGSTDASEETRLVERSQLRQWAHDHTAGALRDQVAEAAVGSVLASLHELVAGRLEEQRKLLIEEELPAALDRYFRACFEAYDALGAEIRGQLKALAALLPKQS